MKSAKKYPKTLYFHKKFHKHKNVPQSYGLAETPPPSLLRKNSITNPFFYGFSNLL